jgi:hypothetical protein
MELPRRHRPFKRRMHPIDGGRWKSFYSAHVRVGYTMISFLICSAMGFGMAVALPLAIVEGLALSIVFAALAERYLFPMPLD